MSMQRVVHLSSAHTHLDTRILIRECQTLARAGYDTHLITPNGEEQVLNSVSIHGVSKAKGGRWSRATLTVVRVFVAAMKLRPDVYHIHDPELCWLGLILRCFGKVVVYDVHEDLPQTMLTKPYLPKVLRQPMSKCVSLLEKFVVRCLSGVVAATPSIAKRFSISKKTLFQNFPPLSDISIEGPPYSERGPIIAYTGGISKARGICELVEALTLVPKELKVRLLLVGEFFDPREQELVEQLPGWKHVDYHGWQPRQRLLELLATARAGVVTFHPVPNHTASQPTKLFEYMGIGVPIIASDFTHWRELIQPTGCGRLVDPQDPAAIAKEIQWMIENPDEAETLGINAKEAVRTQFNLEIEKQKLLTFYEQLLPATKATA